jgi:hypothetical protein
LLGAATKGLEPSALLSEPNRVGMSVAAAVVVTVVWVTVALALGAWRTATRNA